LSSSKTYTGKDVMAWVIESELGFVAWDHLGPAWVFDRARAAKFAREQDAKNYWDCFGSETMTVEFVAVSSN
jgi:hypothetical protein